MAQRVLLHVGTPKTGTSASQNVLFTHREELAADGVLYAADRFDEHFLAALDLMQLPWGGLEREAVGAWDRLAAKIRAWPGTAILSHEIFARASRLQVARAMESFGDAELHVVLSARDLARQLPAEWQENIKHRRTIGYAAFLDAVRDPLRREEIAQWFWSVQELPDILERWGGALPPEQVHVVTVPRPGAPRTLLWERFAGTLGVDPQRYPLGEDRANASLGVAESALVRRLNRLLAGSLPNNHYRQFVREGLVHQGLGVRRESAQLRLPPETHAWAADLSERWIAELTAREYDVVGDIADLRPDPPPAVYADPDHPDEGEVAAAAVRALAASVTESARLREVEIELHAVIEDLMGQLDAAHSTRIYKAKEALVAQADRNPVAKAGLSVYRRARGRNSRSA